MKNHEPEQNHTARAIDSQSNKASDEADELRRENERLKKENARLNHELRREHEAYIRNLADFDYYRRRVERERAQAAQAGKRELILPLLEVMDDCERAIGHANCDSQSMAAGLQAIHHRLSGLLTAEGVAPFDSHGKFFNPLLHEAVDTVKSSGGEPGTVLEEVGRGWRWGAELLRPARVIVAR